MPLTNDTYPHVVFLQSEIKLNNPPLYHVVELVVKLALLLLFDGINPDNKFTHIYTNYKECHILIDHCDLILKISNENV